ncbi:MAG TPA: hypothetical protein EYQ54_19350 [Myxococcales bacterium]|nr:hypothetical protein [Myxococcales bacterium]
MAEKHSDDYLKQKSCLTLREALGEYYRSNPSLLDPSDMSDDVEALFRQHDAGHVFFGCDTSIRGEACIDTWTIFAGSIGLRGYLEYLRCPQVNQIFEETGYWTIALESMRCLPDLLKILVRSRKMSRRWPWREYEQFLDRELRDLREEYGLRVLG